jgi:hypothetical protein
MENNKFEKDSLDQINKLDEGLALGILKFFMRPKLKRALRKLERDPEFKAAIKDLNYHAEALKDKVDNLEDTEDPKLKKIADKYL